MQRQQSHLAAQRIRPYVIPHFRCTLKGECAVPIKLYQQYRQSVVLGHRLCLGVEAAAGEALSQVGDGFALHTHLRGQHVVSHLKRDRHKLQALLVEHRRQVAHELAHIHHDPPRSLPPAAHASGPPTPCDGIVGGDSQHARREQRLGRPRAQQLLSRILQFRQHNVGLVANEALQRAPLAGQTLSKLVCFGRVVIPQMEHPQWCIPPLRFVHLQLADDGDVGVEQHHEARPQVPQGALLVPLQGQESHPPQQGPLLLLRPLLHT
mmetsp:Transcript_4742/g.13636  ORF Transcript_4742/g.13636 Transcript_4742/m.13636 type:complete len:265 (-) Transcript_4742:149-943(-)